MSKMNKILLAITIFLAVVLGFVIYWQKFNRENNYYAVYLNTGDLYFGKLRWFPKFSLSNVYFLKQNVNDTENPLSLAKFSDVFWGPEDKIYLNQEDIVWKSKLKEDSQIVKFIKETPVQSK